MRLINASLFTVHRNYSLALQYRTRDKSARGKSWTWRPGRRAPRIGLINSEKRFSYFARGSNMTSWEQVSNRREKIHFLAILCHFLCSCWPFTAQTSAFTSSHDAPISAESLKRLNYVSVPANKLLLVHVRSCVGKCFFNWTGYSQGNLIFERSRSHESSDI